MSAFTDGRAVSNNTILTPDLAIIGGGPAGMSLAMALAHLPIKILLLESGGMDFDADTQALYEGTQTGVQYLALDGSRLRYLGGSTNHWGGWTRPLDTIDFEKRDWLPHSGWPFSRDALEPYFLHAQSLVEAGPWIYDDQQKWTDALGAPMKLAPGGVYTSYFQFSKQKDEPHHWPTHFGVRYDDTLKQQDNLQVMLHANVTNIGLAGDANSVDHLDVATLTGRKFTVKPKVTVLAVGGMENPRLLLASNDVMKNGIGNDSDMVGRFFADHAIPRDTVTLVSFDGTLAPYYMNPRDAYGAHFRATFAAHDDFMRTRHVLGSLSTVEQPTKLDQTGMDAVSETANALGVDATKARGFLLGCGFELAPDPDRRVTLSGEKDALGMPRLKLHMTISDDDFGRYRETMKEAGRQLLAARSGMMRLNRSERSQWLETLDWANHHMGTTRMDDDPKKGVVDANSKVHGVANLYVAGSSVFPTYGSSNPTMNLVALTLRLADHLKTIFA